MIKSLLSGLSIVIRFIKGVSIRKGWKGQFAISLPVYHHYVLDPLEKSQIVRFLVGRRWGLSKKDVCPRYVEKAPEPESSPTGSPVVVLWRMRMEECPRIGRPTSHLHPVRDQVVEFAEQAAVATGSHFAMGALCLYGLYHCMCQG